MSTDTDLLIRSRGTPQCFAELYDRHFAAIYRFAAARVGSGGAEDVTAETFLVAFDRRDTFDPTIGEVRPWLFGIANHLLKAYRRTEARHWSALRRAGLADSAGDGGGRPLLDELEDRLDAARLVSSLAGALGRMKRRDQETLLLFALGDLTYAEIAQATGAPVGTVRSRLHRIRRVLRSQPDLAQPSLPQKDVTDHDRLRSEQRTA